MKKTLVLLFFTLFLPLNLFADETYRVLDEKGRVLEYWKEKDGTIEIYNPDWSRKGFIKKKDGRLERYDQDWQRRGYGEREDFRDSYEEEEGKEE